MLKDIYLDQNELYLYRNVDSWHSNLSMECSLKKSTKLRKIKLDKTTYLLKK